jgi:hypothetical protein
MVLLRRPHLHHEADRRSGSFLGFLWLSQATEIPAMEGLRSRPRGTTLHRLTRDFLGGFTRENQSE